MTAVYRASTDHVAPSSPPSRARGGLPVCSSLWLPLHAASTRNFLYCPTTTDTDSGAEIQRRFVDATSCRSVRRARWGLRRQLQRSSSRRLGGRADGIIIIVAAAACSCPFVAGTLHADARSVRRRCRVRPAPCRRLGARAAQLCLRSHRRFAS